MKALRIVATMASGGILTFLNFALNMLFLFLFTPTPSGLNPSPASWVISVISVVAVYGFIVGLFFGLFLGLFNRDAGFATAFGAIAASLLCLIYWQDFHRQMPAPLALVLVLFFISSSALVGFLTIQTATGFCRWLKQS